MTLVYVGPNNTPNFMALSTDISGGKIAGASREGNTLFTTDDSKLYVVGEDETLLPYELPVVLNGDITIGTVGQGDASLTEKWLVDASGVVLGGVTETAPASDTASSGLNGRLQRIAQRLTSLIALLPTALGANGGLKIEGVASGTVVPVSGTVTVNAGTNLNTSTLALESGGNLATIVSVLPGSLGQKVSASSLPVVLPSDQTISTTISSGITSSPAITTSASPDYSAGDSIGGIITLPTIVSAAGGKAKLSSINVVDKAGQAPAFSIYFFKATPAAGTYTDNAAVVWGSGDGANCIGLTSFVSADYNTVAGISFSAMGDINQIHTATATSIFSLIIADGTYNAATTSDLIITFGYERE